MNLLEKKPQKGAQYLIKHEVVNIAKDYQTKKQMYEALLELIFLVEKKIQLAQTLCHLDGVPDLYKKNWEELSKHEKIKLHNMKTALQQLEDKINEQ